MIIPEPLPVFAINLKHRTDRKKHITQEFLGRKEFHLTVVEAREHSTGAIGLWQTICRLTDQADRAGLELIILCEDDHAFTEDYSPERLFEVIAEAAGRDADILLGGPSWFSGALQASHGMFWVDQFAGLQFTVIFRKFFNQILTADFAADDAADFKMAEISDSKYFMHPSISTQLEFGYSDATTKNNELGRVDRLFDVSRKCAATLVDVNGFYRKMERAWAAGSVAGAGERDESREEGEANPRDQGREDDDTRQISLATYIIHRPGRPDRRRHISDQFRNRAEFDLRHVQAGPAENEALSLFYAIRQVAADALVNEDDVIVLCEDDHQFTPAYAPGPFIDCIIEAASAGAEILSGGVGRIDQLVPVSGRLFWTSAIWHLQFLVIFKSAFRKILEEPASGVVDGKDIFMRLTSHKMLLAPFISTKKDFGDPPYNAQPNQAPISDQFAGSIRRIETISRKSVKLLSA